MAKTSTNTIAITIVVIFMIAAGALALQVYIPSGDNVTSQQMSDLVASLSPQEQSQLATSDEARKEFAKNIQELLAVGKEAKAKGYETKDPKTAMSMDFTEKQLLADQYQTDQQKKNQPAQVTDDERKKYEAANPKAFDDFFAEYAKSDPRAAQAPPEQLAGFKKQYEDIMIMSDKAKAERLDRDPSFELQLKLSKAQILARQYVGDLQKDLKVTPEDEQKYYDEHKGEYEQVHARHILISTRPLQGQNPSDDEDENGPPKTKPAEQKPIDKVAAKAKAEDLLKQAKSGKDFVELAKANTDEPQGKTNGGDLGYFTRGKMVKEFEDAAFKLQPGQISDVVESPFGYHIIKVEDHRTAPLTDVKSEIDEKLKEEKFKKTIDDIVARTHVKVATDFKVNAPAGGGGVQSLPGGMPQGHP